jgi:GntR family carbon starvation induced transcriptional regulator
MDDKSVTGRAYEILRNDLIACRLQPGAQLNIAALQTRLSLSQGAIREALSRLTSEGLVEIERNRGFRVAPVSASGFKELTLACMTIELPCLRASIRNGDLEWELNLVSTYHRAARTLDLVVLGKEGIDAYSRERQAFYEALLAACDNHWLLWSWRLLYVQNMRYRHIYMPLAKFEHDLNPHHANFMQAVLARDVEKAVELGRQNYDMVANFIEALMAREAESTKPRASAEVTRRKRAVPA